MSSTPIQSYRAAIDWLTLATYRFESYTDAAAQMRARYPGKWKAANWLQYAGFKHPEYPIMYGKALQTNDKEHYVVKTSGSFADEFATWFLSLECADSFYCTRIDVQRTKSIPDWWDVRLLHDELHECSTVSMIQSESGSTLYLGSRTSDRFTRFYEKDLDGKLLRLEIELKGRYSRQAWSLLLAGEHREDCYSYHVGKLRIADHMKAYYLADSTNDIDWSIAEKQSSMRSKLRWLHTLVPTFDKMSNDHDIGSEVRDLFYSLSIGSIDRKSETVL